MYSSRCRGRFHIVPLVEIRFTLHPKEKTTSFMVGEGQLCCQCTSRQRTCWGHCSSRPCGFGLRFTLRRNHLKRRSFLGAFAPHFLALRLNDDVHLSRVNTHAWGDKELSQSVIYERCRRGFNLSIILQTHQEAESRIPLRGYNRSDRRGSPRW